MNDPSTQKRRFIDTRLGIILVFGGLVLVFMTFHAWYQSGTGIITVKEIANHNVASPGPRRVTVVDISGTEFSIGGPRYAVLGGQSAVEIWQLLKADCRYEISFHWDSSDDSLFAREFMVINGAKLIDCPPPPPREPPPRESAREIMERLVRPQ